MTRFIFSFQFPHSVKRSKELSKDNQLHYSSLSKSTKAASFDQDIRSDLTETSPSMQGKGSHMMEIIKEPHQLYIDDEKFEVLINL